MFGKGKLCMHPRRCLLEVYKGCPLLKDKPLEVTCLNDQPAADPV